MLNFQLKNAINKQQARKKYQQLENFAHLKKNSFHFKYLMEMEKKDCVKKRNYF